MKPISQRIVVSLVALGVGASACQVVSPSQPASSQPRLAIDQSALSAPVPKPATLPDITYTVKRGTIQDALTMPGQVVAGRASQLSFPSAGTITSVEVRTGQAVKKGDPIAILTLDAQALQAADQKVKLAQLAYESQLAKLKDLQAGASPSALEDAQAGVVKAQAALAKAQAARDAAADAPPPSDGDVALAHLALDQANENLAQAQKAASQASAAAGSAQARAQAIAQQTQAKTDEQNQYDAQTTAAAADAAQRRAVAADAKLQQARQAMALAQANRDADLKAAKIALAEAKDNVTAAQAAVDRANKETSDGTNLTPAQVDADRATANANLKTAQHGVDLAQVKLDQVNAAAKMPLDDDVKAAQLELDQARADFAAAQAAAQHGQRVAAVGPALQPDQPQSSADLQAAEVAAQHSVDEAALKVQQAEQNRASDAAARDASARNAVTNADADLKAAQADLDAAQAKLADVQTGPNQDAIAREQAQADLLRDDFLAAQKAAQPTLNLTAPFDGQISSMDVNPGQTVDARASVARIADTATLSVVANATQYDVPHLSPGETVGITFASLGNGNVQGALQDVGGAAAGPGQSDKDKTVYPVRVDLSAIPPSLRIGMTASVSLTLRQAENVLYVPQAAVKHQGDKTLVTRVDPSGTVADVPVQLGDTYGTNVEIKGGLLEADVVGVNPPATSASAKQP